MANVKGRFEVKRTPADDADGVDGMQRFRLDKVFHGALAATSKGAMLAMGNASGSAGYVAMERVVGKLDGRSGSFALQHSGTMDRGKPTLAISVVPDSGTDELLGLTGTMQIEIGANAEHWYVFDYEIA